MNANCLRLYGNHCSLARRHPPPLRNPHRLLPRLFWCIQQRIPKFSRPQTSILLIPPVRKRLRCHAKSRRAKLLQHHRPRQSHHHHILPPPPHAVRDPARNPRILRRLVVKRPVRLHVHHRRAAFLCNLPERHHLPVHRTPNLLRAQIQRHPPEIFAVLISRMRPHGHAMPQRLLDCRAHHLFIARVPAASHIRRRHKLHQRFLAPIRQHLRQFAHVAIQIHALHANSRSSEPSNTCCSIHNSRAAVSDTSSNRIVSRGRNCPTQCKSAPITFAIFGYPPVVCCSTNKRIACPDGVT